MERHFRDRSKGRGEEMVNHFDMERMLKELKTGNPDFAIITKMISKRVIVLLQQCSDSTKTVSF